MAAYNIVHNSKGNDHTINRARIIHVLSSDGDGGREKRKYDCHSGIYDGNNVDR